MKPDKTSGVVHPSVHDSLAMPGREYEKVLDAAADQFGYVATSQDS